jgi:hypothetical protein
VRADDVASALDAVGRKWTRQVKAEERRSAARVYRRSMWTRARVPLKDICYEHLPQAWAKASDRGRLPTHWRQVFYVMRPICDAHPGTDRPLTDATFKRILESYLADHRPGWDVLRGARGVFKEPHAHENDRGLALSTAQVRDYLAAERPSPTISPLRTRFPTAGARDRIAAVLVCEKEGFDELLQAERVPERYDLALMSTKGISALAARDLARGLGVPCFTLHDLDKNGFVMAAGFRPFAIDLGIRLDDVGEWGLAPEEQHHPNPARTRRNLLQNGATEDEADFIAGGERVELNMLTGPEFVEYVERKLQQHGVRKVVPDDATLAAAWKRARLVAKVNRFISETASDDDPDDAPADLADRIRQRLHDDPAQPWDAALYDLTLDTPDHHHHDDEDDE